MEKRILASWRSTEGRVFIEQECIRPALLNTAYIFKDLLYNYLDWMRKKCAELIKEPQFIGFNNHYLPPSELQVLGLSVRMVVLIFMSFD